MNAGLADIIPSFRGRRVLVIGDAILDRYSYGRVERISPEAPVPIVEVERVEHRCGGAASVAVLLRGLGVEVTLGGALAGDREAHILLGLAQDAGIQCRVLTDNHSTIVKHRYIGLAHGRHPQQLLRVDSGQRQELTAESRQLLLQGLEDPQPEAIVSADYGKGVVTGGLMRAVNERYRGRVPILVDPHQSSDLRIFGGADLLKPNRWEAQLQSTDLGDIAGIASDLRRELGLGALLVTLDSQGAVLCQKAKDWRTLYLAAHARRTYDVTGAGDTVIAVLAAAMAAGQEVELAAELAMVAGGLQVEQLGVHPITPEALEHEILGGPRKPHSLAEVLREVGERRARGQRVVFTNGCFDVLHAGHAELLRAARNRGDYLVVGVNSDESVRRLKGANRPRSPQEARTKLLRALESVDATVVFDSDTPEELIAQLTPDVLVKGGDYTRDQIVGADYVESHGGQVYIVPLTGNHSTTKILGGG